LVKRSAIVGTPNGQNRTAFQKAVTQSDDRGWGGGVGKGNELACHGGE